MCTCEVCRCVCVGLCGCGCGWVLLHVPFAVCTCALVCVRVCVPFVPAGVHGLVHACVPLLFARAHLCVCERVLDIESGPHVR